MEILARVTWRKPLLMGRHDPAGFFGHVGDQSGNVPRSGYDPAKDLTPIGTIATAAAVLVVYPGLPIKTLEELITYAKANPDKLNYASSGTGTVVHVSTEMVLDAAGIKIRHIPYRGTGPAVSDVLAGHDHFIMPPIPSVVGMIKSGQLRAIAVTSKTRSPLLPNVPTINEAGLPGLRLGATRRSIGPLCHAEACRRQAFEDAERSSCRPQC